MYVLYLPEYKIAIYSIFTCVKDGNFFLIPYLINGGHLAVAHRVTEHFVWALSEYLAGEESYILVNVVRTAWVMKVHECKTGSLPRFSV